MLNIETVVCGALEENAYIVSKKGEAGAFLIDPGDDYASLVRALAGRSLEAICLTHAHYDHMLSAPGLIADTGAKLYVSARDIPALNDARLNLYNPAWSRLPAPQGLKALAYGETLEVCGVQLEILPTPGHTPGGVCLYARDEGVLFSGDTLFCAGYGRVDFPGSSAADMRASLLRLFALPGETRVFPGHGGETTIARERARYQL
ncbi:MAG TPA: MBL fold metallo-hydrolase [Candidatus Pullichristensenella avicola]|nr:MBL fold metallo-hydrolase [Candidatus Pullichristensenella avicola]